MSFKDEEGKTHTFFKPAICCFGGKPITKFEGQYSDSIVIHSLDGNHNNWAPENKTPSHLGCHTKFHLTGVPKSVEARKKMSLAKTGEKHPMYGKRGEGTGMYGKHLPEKTIEKMRKAKTGKNNPMYNNPEAIKRGWKTRRERYGPSGTRKKICSEETKERLRLAALEQWEKTTPEQKAERGRKIWKTRRKRYGSTGRKKK